MHNHQVNINGGTNNMHYSLSGGFLDQDGIGVGSNFRRASFRANFDTNVTEWLQVGANASYASTKQVITFDETVEGKGDALAGLTFVITGKVEHFANRDEVKAAIEAAGGKTTGSVTSKTDYLINNDINSTSGKNKKARELGIPVISEEDFLAMLEV